MIIIGINANNVTNSNNSIKCTTAIKKTKIKKKFNHKHTQTETFC